MLTRVRHMRRDIRVSCDHRSPETSAIGRVYVPTLQRVPGVLGFFRDHRGQPIASSALMTPISAAFVAAIRVSHSPQCPDVPRCVPMEVEPC